MAQPEEWYADAQAESGADWFNAEVGVQLDGQKVNLLPILMDFFAERKDLFGASAISQLDEQRAWFWSRCPTAAACPFPSRASRSCSTCCWTSSSRGPR